MTNTKQVYLIHPVKNITDAEKEYLDNYVYEKEKKGILYHYPIRDVVQDDPTGGLRICCDHRRAAEEVERAEIYFSSKSNGSMFDAGMIVYENKPIEIINPKILKSLEGFTLDFFKNYSLHQYTGSESFDKIMEKRREIKNSGVINCRFDKTPQGYLELGMIFMSKKPIILENIKEVIPPTDRDKSYEKVFLRLDGQSREILAKCQGFPCLL